MSWKNLTRTFCFSLLFIIPASSETPGKATEIKRFVMDSLEGVITRTGVELDRAVSSDGNASVLITAAAPASVRLFEVRDISIENARLIYQARVRTEAVEGQVYLEMWCHFPGKGEFFSRGLNSPLSGNTDWSTLETPFFLKKGERPDFVRLNLVFTGRGKAWIDDIRLLKGPLH